MNTDLLFRVANTAAMLSWVVLAVAPNNKATKMLIRSGGVSLAFSVLYTALFLMGSGFSFSDFQSIAGVQGLFANPIFLLAGWVHYLAFDLLIGNWIVKDAETKQIKHYFVIPSLFLTFMFGPMGFLSYLILRKALRRA